MRFEIKNFKPLTFLLDLIFPIKCLSCRKEGQWLCKKCFVKTESLPSPKAKLESKNLDRLIAVFDYHHPLIKKLISVYKYHFVSEISKTLADFLLKKLSPYLGDTDLKKFVLIPMPLHKKRLRFRGFNQAELLARNLSQKLKVKLRNDLLVRCRHTPPQVKVALTERKKNIKSAFRAKKDLSLKSKTIILVDDVTTSGATLEAAAQAILARNKPREIWGLVVAKG